MKSLFTILGVLLMLHTATSQGFHEYMKLNSHRPHSEIIAELDAYYESNPRGKGTGFNQYKRWSDYAARHLDGDGRIANVPAMNMRALRGYQQSHDSDSATSRSTHGSWIVEGPTDYTTYVASSSALGRVNRLGFHPSDPNTIYACTPAGGLWKTTDHAVTWSCMTDHLPVIGCSGIALNPNNTDIMYLLSGDGDQWNTPSIGVLKSTDGGATWQQTGPAWAPSQGVRAFKLLMHPNNSSLLFIATSKGIYRSTDAGQSWGQIQSGFFWDLEFMPTDPSRMYATDTCGFYLSLNTGSSFTLQNDTDFPAEFSRVEIGVTPADSSYVYLVFGGATGVNGTFKGFFHSDDFGTDFVEQSTTPNILGYEIFGADDKQQAWYDLSIAVHPTDPDFIFVGGVNTWRSYDKGVTWGNYSHWQNFGASFAHADFHDLIYNGTTLFAANDGGVYETTNPKDAISYFTDLSEGLCITQPYNIDVLNSEVILGSQDNGSLRWDMSATFTATAEFGADGFDCMWDPSTPTGPGRVIYVSTQSSIELSTTDGASFGPINVPGYGNGDYWYVDLMMHPQNFDTIYAGVGDGNPASDVFRSYNRGGTWTDLNFGLSKNINAMAFAPSNPDIVVVATRDSMVMTSNIHAATPSWDTLGNIPVGGRNITDVVFHPDNASILYATIAGYGNGLKVYRSVNGGGSWQNFSGTLPNVPFHCLLIEDNATHGIYAGCDIGVFYRNDNMSDWIFFSQDLPNVPVRDLDIDGGRIYAGTHGRGIWSTPAYSSCPASLNITSATPGNGTQVYHTSSSIISTQVINGGLGTDISYHSEGEITLTTGFHAKADHLFEVTLENCPD